MSALLISIIDEISPSFHQFDERLSQMKECLSCDDARVVASGDVYQLPPVVMTPVSEAYPRTEKASFIQSADSHRSYSWFLLKANRVKLVSEI
jgi:hypothetical protein